jgi:hypothetical protein
VTNVWGLGLMSMYADSARAVAVGYAGACLSTSNHALVLRHGNAWPLRIQFPRKNEVALGNDWPLRIQFPRKNEVALGNDWPLRIQFPRKTEVVLGNDLPLRIQFPRKTKWP